jgi:hypothetical protein
VGQLTRDDLIDDRALREEDADALGHGPIAERVAELVTQADTPLNVALFGAWGSGKSSFANLLDRALRSAPKSPRLVRYNAWTFEGESFQRNFVSSVATELDVREEDDRDYIQFHSGLYETRRQGRLELSRKDVLRIGGLAALLFLVVIAMLSLLIAALSYLLGSKDPVKAAVDAIPGLIPTTAVAGLLGSVTREIVAGARVNVDTSAPTQEQFRATFEKLLKVARDRKHVGRLVFFIDELDRCAPEQVVTVLAAVRHFYDLPDCVFVIAADRQAIEQAIKDTSQQAVPLNTATPYYSSAGEYIDKIFQHQLTLPPLRGRTLTRFARDLVLAKKAGLWSRLAVVDNGKLRDQLIYVLIPAHVRSPRRVKVLLNNFATNVRIAEARGVEVIANALEMAKLVTLRTEFPLFAADLVVEPHLPEFLLAPPEVATQSPRLKELLERHRLPGPTVPDDAALNETDVTLARSGGSGQDANDPGQKRLRRAERSLLRNYLIRTSRFPNPGLDLLYLEPAGAAVGLADNDFGLMIEEASAERPQEVIDAAANQPDEEKLKALRILADMVNDEFGQERTNVVTALLGIAESVDNEVGAYDGELLGALKLYQEAPGFEANHLAGILGIALSAGDKTLSDAVLADDRLLADAEATGRAAFVAGRMTEDQRKVVWEKVIEFYPGEPQLIEDPLTSLDVAVATELIELPALSKAIRTRLDELEQAEAVAEVKNILGQIAGRPGNSERIRGAYLLRLPDQVGNGYAALLACESDLSSFRKSPAWSNLIALKAIRLGPPDDWSVWRPHLAKLKHPAKGEGERASLTAASILTRWAAAESAGVGHEAMSTLVSVCELIPQAIDAEFVGAARAPAKTLTEAGPAGRPPLWWWQADSLAEPQMRLHATLLQLGIGPKTHAAMSELVVTDLERALAPALTDLASTAIRSAIEHLEGTDLQRLAASLKGITPDPPRIGAIGLARLAALRAIKMKGGNPTDPAINFDAPSVVELLGSADRQAGIEQWFALEPDAADGRKVAVAIGKHPPENELSPVAAWSRTLPPHERGQLLLDLSALDNDTSGWMGALADELFDEAPLLTSLISRLRSAGRGDERKELARTIVAIRPSEPASVKAVGELIQWVLDPARGTIDRGAAVTLVSALVGRSHRMGTALAAAFELAERQGLSISKKAREEFANAGFKVKKPGIAENVKRALRGSRRNG